MERKEIIYDIKNSGLDLDEVICISGASLVVQGIIKSTDDIDFACSMDYYKKINWSKKIGSYNLEIKYRDNLEVSFNLYYPDDIIIIEGIKFLNLERCLQIKKELNREKDKEIIKKIENILKNKK